ncbi:MAG: 4Fe-4S dicluster domain-containing protein [bacterium]|jgi:molybdopterin-containing oxidoreductase family iron-sulfur binding subunit
MNRSRREFIAKGALAAAVGAAASAGVLPKAADAQGRDPAGKESVRKLDALSGIAPQQREDNLLRMQRELVAAMSKPVEERHWVMVIDQRKCVGCHACTVACVSENNLPPGVVYRPVQTIEEGTFPELKLSFLPKPCNHCNKPPCISVCPVDATWKRPDGVVAIDYDKCIGCQLCIPACPYSHRQFDEGNFYTRDSAAGDAGTGVVLGPEAPWEGRSVFEYGKLWDRANGDSPNSKTRKCHFCLHRLENGQLPQCTTTCIGRATSFGDANDKSSLVSELIANHETFVLLPEKGTSPQVYYIK